MSNRVGLFAGQGAQRVGMGQSLVERFEGCRKMAEQARAALGFDVMALCREGPEERLTRSDVAQPAIFLVSAMCLEAWREQEGDASAGFLAVAGLSLGEWTALYAAGVLSFEDTLRVLNARGRFMQEACEQTEGGMLSVMGLSLEDVRRVAEASGLEVANVNSSVQVVLSGPRQQLPVAEQKALELGAKRAIPLQVAGAFHSSLMRSAALRLEEYLAGITFATPAVPVVSNVTARPHEADPEAMKALMVRQVTAGVRWLECMEWARGQGAGHYVEFGPGNVLTGLVKRIHKGAVLRNIQEADDL